MLKVIKVFFSKKKPLLIVPRFLDLDLTSPENLNARAILPFLTNDFNIIALRIGKVDSKFKKIYSVKIFSRLSPYLIFLFSLLPCDIFFYPGHEWFDYKALKYRKFFKIKGKIITTLEGCPFINQKDKKIIEKKLGHSFYTLTESNSKSMKLNNFADHVVAISPMLKTVAEHIYKTDVSFLDLGYDDSIFYPPINFTESSRMRVISVGTIYDRKRPFFFLKLAKALPEVDFFWYGQSRDNNYLERLKEEISIMNLKNIFFKGSLSHMELASKLRESHLFVMPSKVEGSPKSALEAIGCGLPLVLFGYYEAPFAFHGKNASIVWSDDDFIREVKLLLKNFNKLKTMSKESIQISRDYTWDYLSRDWLNKLKILK